MADPKNKYKEMLAAGVTGIIAGGIKTPKRRLMMKETPERRLMMKETRVEEEPLPRYGYRGTDNPKHSTHTRKLTTYDKKKPATKKKPKKKKPVVRMPIPEYRRPTPKTKKRIKGTLRDNLPIFGGPGRVPEG